VRLWRLARAPFAAFDGVGSARGGSRWSSKSIPILFASSTQSLALLEVLVHTPRELIPDDYVFIAIEIPDDRTQSVSKEMLPPDWADSPPPTNLKAIGDDWARSNRSCALLIPSVIVPNELNCMINPRHPDFSRIEISTPISFILDKRFHGSR